MKKRKRFYNNKGRNEKWTQAPVGRKIYFADKYIDDGDGDNKFKIKSKTKKPFFSKENGEKLLRQLIAAAFCLVLIGIGYTIMDIHLERNAMPFESAGGDDTASLNEVQISVKGTQCQPLSLDGDIMLSSVINTSLENGYTSLAFELKRNDGTIGYESQLATIEAYGAISSPAGNLQDSVKLLNENDLLPIGIISCYKDNIAPAADPSCAAFQEGKVFTDSGSNTYMNPEADNTYNYLKSIIDEALGMGITVFALDNYDLPSDIKENYNDGFDALTQRLYGDFGSEIKFFQIKSINLTSSNAKALEKEWEEKTENIDTDDNSTLFYLSAADTAMLKQFLDNRGITNYIICE